MFDRTSIAWLRLSGAFEYHASLNARGSKSGGKDETALSSCSIVRASCSSACSTALRRACTATGGRVGIDHRLLAANGWARSAASRWK